MTGPRAVAYVSVPAHVSAGSHEETMTEAVAALTAFAEREGYELAGVFTDVRHRTETGLYALLDAVRHGHAAAVVVPHLDHLTHAGCLTGADSVTAARYLRARLLPADRHPATPTAGRHAPAAAAGDGAGR